MQSEKWKRMRRELGKRGKKGLQREWESNIGKKKNRTIRESLSER